MKITNIKQYSMGWSLCRGGKFISLLAAIFLSISCASTPDKEPQGPVFYPPLPNPPRIQYLTSFASIRDLGGTNSFSDFILGKDNNSESLLAKPYGVAIWNGKLFAVDTRGPGYVVFDLKSRRASLVSGSGAGRMKKPINLVLDEEGYRYVTDTERDQILMFDQQDKFIRAFGKEGQFKPTDLAIVGDKMYVVDIAHHKIQVLDRYTGNIIQEIGKPGSKALEFFQPTNIKLGSDNNLYISDTGNFRVEVITQDGKFVRSIGKAGSGLGNFARPKGVAIDKQGQVLVVDAAFNNVQVFRTDGRLLLYFGGTTPDTGGLSLPTDIEIDYKNVDLFQKYAAPGFKLDYVILVASQFGPNKISVYGYGKMEGMDYH